MRIVATLFAGSLALSTAVAGGTSALSVADVIARHEALNGKIVHVRGWLLERCYRFSCGINASKDTSSERLSIGGSDSFDLALREANIGRREIVVEGRVNRNCFQHPKGDPAFDPDLINICTDRADELANPRLIKIFPASAQDK